MTTILALDLGTLTGWAMKCESGIKSGSVNFATKRNEGGGMRYLRFRRWLDSINTGITEIHFEEVRRHAGTQAAHVYGGLMGTLTSWCEENSIPYSSVPVGTIKRAATGKGNATKEQMIEAVKRRGFNPSDDNEADALALLGYVTEPFKVGEVIKISGCRNFGNGEFVIKSIRTPAFETDCALVSDDKIEIK